MPGVEVQSLSISSSKRQYEISFSPHLLDPSQLLSFHPDTHTKEILEVKKDADPGQVAMKGHS